MILLAALTIVALASAGLVMVLEAFGRTAQRFDDCLDVFDLFPDCIDEHDEHDEIIW